MPPDTIPPFAQIPTATQAPFQTSRGTKGSGIWAKLGLPGSAVLRLQSTYHPVCLEGVFFVVKTYIRSTILTIFKCCSFL